MDSIYSEIHAVVDYFIQSLMIAVILAGGEGTRAGGNFPKQFQPFCGKPLIWWSMNAFRKFDPDIKLYVAIHPGFFNLMVNLWAGLSPEDRIPYKEVCGGRTRIESVSNALSEIDAQDSELIAVHDAARPIVTPRLIERGFNMARNKGNAVPVVPVTDSLRRLEGSSENSCPVKRSEYVAVQTPQIFKYDILKRGYGDVDIHSEIYTDDASIVQASGEEIYLFEGDFSNMKITNPIDFKVGEILLLSR